MKKLAIILLSIGSFPAYGMLDEGGLQQFHTAISQDCRKYVSDILERRPLAVKQADIRGDTALHIAAQHSVKDMMSMLMKYINRYRVFFEDQSALDMQNKSGSTPLISAVIWGNGDAFTILLKKASPNVNSVDIYQRTALHYAAWLGYAGMAQMLIKAGANLDMQDKDNKSPYDLAVDRHSKKSRIMELFIEVNGDFLESCMKMFLLSQDSLGTDMSANAEEAQKGLQYNVAHSDKERS